MQSEVEKLKEKEAAYKEQIKQLELEAKSAEPIADLK